MSKIIEIEYPDYLPDLLEVSSDVFEKEAKMAMVVKLFELKRISSGLAAEMVGIDRATFLLELHRYGVEMIDMEPEELASDVKNA